ncbi:hypothetical protein [Actinoallomurus sp. CA-150999]|uniref:hypothetical protein n=1 Tax=Actinoallomurus sp. CA-150999 TaxID=3239887 RepID=UPI003D9446E7
MSLVVLLSLFADLSVDETVFAFLYSVHIFFVTLPALPQLTSLAEVEASAIGAAAIIAVEAIEAAPSSPTICLRIDSSLESSWSERDRVQPRPKASLSAFAKLGPAAMSRALQSLANHSE